MITDTILDLISQGEGVTIEFKECRNEVAAEVYPTVCSFSNRFGGHIFMGVNDAGDVRTNLIDSYERLTDFLCRHMNDKFYLEGTQRVSIRSIIAREIVSNILMHREYTSPFPAKIIIEKTIAVGEKKARRYIINQYI